jgi:hypothetical protein
MYEIIKLYLTSLLICVNGVHRGKFTSNLSRVTRALICDVDRSNRQASLYFELAWRAASVILIKKNANCLVKQTSRMQFTE